jgi:hypothetical protein
MHALTNVKIRNLRTQSRSFLTYHSNKKYGYSLPMLRCCRTQALRTMHDIDKKEREAAVQTIRRINYRCDVKPLPVPVVQVGSVQLSAFI